MKSILLPVDFSSGTHLLCKYAVEFACDEQAKIILFHIYPDQLIVPDSSFPIGLDTDSIINAEYINQIRKQARIKMIELENWFRAFLKENGKSNIEVSQLVSGGDPEYEITELCKELNPDLIIMGTRGEGQKAVLEGSMAKNIMSKTTVPVFAIPDAITKIKIKNVLYATNFSKNDYSLLQTLYQNFSGFDIELFVVHLELKDHPKEDDMMMEGLKNALTKDYPDKKIHFQLFATKNKNAALRSYVIENNIDVIAFIAHKSSFFKNLFSSQIHKKDFFKLNIPMLALHEE